MGSPDFFRLRAFQAAATSRLTESLAYETEMVNRTLRYQLRMLRARARQACQNNAYAKRWAAMVMANVAGPTPFKLQAKAKFANGRLDTTANARLEDAWREWGRRGNCEISGRWSLAQVLRTIVRTLAVDGEALIRLRSGKGPLGLALELIDVDRLDEQHNVELPGGGAIVMSVELDADGRIVAYHLLNRRPAQLMHGTDAPKERVRIPADQMLHLFIPDSAEQVRGVPWLYAALLNLVHLGAFEEAAVIAARVGASQMGFLETPDGEPPAIGAAQDANGNPLIDAEPGAFPVLPAGMKLAGWNPKYPDAAVEPFLRACLRGVAAGLDVAYHNLTGDMTQVNYSSARIAELDERDMWTTVQGFVIEHLMEPLFLRWLDVARLTNRLPADTGRLSRPGAVQFQGRRWAWVDPQKEVDSAVTAIENGLKSRTRVAAEQGEDLEDILDEIAAEQQMAADKGVTLGAVAPAAPEPEDEPEKEEPDDE